jgi:Protein of unknown function (DUF3551)
MQSGEKKMKHSCKMITALAVAMSTFGLIATANAADFCRTDVTSGVRGCGYASLAQCQDMSSGRGGTCAPNPFPAPASSAFAMYPRHAAHAKSKTK